MSSAMQSNTSDEDGLSIERSGHRLTYLGKDDEGWHHHHDVDEDRILVVDDAGEDVERGAVIYRELDADAVNHVQDGVQHRDLQRWMAYVALERGWDDAALWKVDVETIWGAVERSLTEEDSR